MKEMFSLFGGNSRGGKLHPLFSTPLLLRQEVFSFSRILKGGVDGEEGSLGGKHICMLAGHIQHLDKKQLLTCFEM